MLNQQQSQKTEIEDPLLNIFEEGMEEFVHYERQSDQKYKTRGQKHRQKIEKIEKEMNDPQLKKKRNKERRLVQKTKIAQIVQKMNKEELKQFIQGRKLKKQTDRTKVRKAMLEGQVMMIDLVFEDKMNGKQNRSLAKQIQLIMKSIKQLNQPPSIHLCSFQGGIKVQLQKMGYQNLPMTVHCENVLQVGEILKKKLVYLSPDAEQTLDKIEQDTAYILGGLIDRTIIKHASLIRSNNLNIPAKRLPIRQFMKSRTVLNLDHVVMMVCKFKQVNDWKTAFDFAAPKRWKKDSKEEIQNRQSSEENQEIQKIEKSIQLNSKVVQTKEEH